MKAVVVVPYYHPYVGGLEVYARQMNVALKELEGMDITVVCSGEKNGIQINHIDGIKVYRLGRWFKISNTPFNPMWTRQMKRIFSQEQPDIILAHAPVPSVAAAASRAKGGTPFIVFYHAATLYKKGAVLFNAVAWVYQMLGKRLLERADRIFAVSGFVKENLAEDLKAKASVVPNAVWEREIVDKRQGDGYSFLFIGSLNRSHAWKGLPYVLRAVAKCRQDGGEQVTLTILGEGDMMQEYKQQAQDLGIADAVDFRGLTTGQAKQAALREARALIVYPTTNNDAFPTVMIEAWSQYTPVIAASIGPMPSLITDGVDGLLAPPADAEALASSLQRMIALPAKSRARIAKQAAERTKKFYTWERLAQTVYSRIGDVL